MQFQEKLQKLRKDVGMTQLELAEKLMVSRQAISKWETGSAIPDLENMVAICKLFDVSLDYLVRDIQEETETKEIPEEHIRKEEKQNNRKLISIRGVIIMLIISIIVLIIGWKMNVLATTIIAMLWLILFACVYCIGRVLIALISKYIEEGRRDL